MPGFLLHLAADVMCAHGGGALPVKLNQRVIVSGQPTVLLATPYAVAGCALTPTAGGPCMTAQWITGTVRVMSNGQPLLVQIGSAICAPTGTPLIVVATQTRVAAV